MQTQGYHEALCSYFKGDYSAAIESCNNVLKINPNHDATLYLASKIYFDQENWNESSVYLLKASQADPKNEFITNEIGFMYSALGNYMKAAETYERLIKEHPYAAAHYFAAFENWLKAKDYKSAVKVLEWQKKVLGPSIELILNESRVYRLTSRPEESAKSLEEGIRLFPAEPRILAPLIDLYLENKESEKAMELLRQLCSADPSNGYARYLFGNYLITQGKQEDGEKMLRESVQLKGLSIDQKAEVVLKMNKAHGCTPENEQLTFSFEEQHPEAFVAHTLCGDLKILCDQPFAALTFYQKALAQDPNAFPVWQTTMLLSYREEIWDSLYAISTQCIALFPLQPFPYLMQGVALNQLKNCESAAFSLETGKLYVINDLALTLQFEANEALLDVCLGKYNPGKAKLNRLFEQYPDNIPLQSEVAATLLEHKELVTYADSLINHCLSYNPKDPQFMALKAKKYLLGGNLNQAKEWLDKAQKNRLPARVGKELEGDIALLEGNVVQAKKLWKEASVLGNHSLRLRKKNP